MRVEMDRALPELLVLVKTHDDHRTANAVAAVEVSQRTRLELRIPSFSHANTPLIFLGRRKQLTGAELVQTLKHAVNTHSLNQSPHPRQPSNYRPRDRRDDAARRPDTQTAESS